MANPVSVGVDGSAHSASALRFAADEACRRGLELRIVHVMDSPSLGPGHQGFARSPRSQVRLEADRVLADLCDQVRRRAPGLAVSARMRTGDAGAALIEESGLASVLVIGARGGHGFPGLRLGAASIQVAMNAHCPVVVVPTRTGAPDGPVVVGVDDSATAAVVLWHALQAAALRRVELLAVHAWRPPMPQWPQRVLALPESFADLQRHEHERLDAEVARWRPAFPGVAAATRLLPGEAAPTLLAAARRASLLVIGARRIGVLRGAVSGSVGLQVLNQATCPVVVVHPHRHADLPEQAEPVVG